MSAPELTEAEAAIVARFEAAPVPPEAFDPIAALRRVADVVTQMDEHADTMDNTAEAWKRLDHQADWARCAAVADALREHTDRLRAALAPQAAR